MFSYFPQNLITKSENIRMSSPLRETNSSSMIKGGPTVKSASKQLVGLGKENGQVLQRDNANLTSARKNHLANLTHQINEWEDKSYLRSKSASSSRLSTVEVLESSLLCCLVYNTVRPLNNNQPYYIYIIYLS